MAYLDFDQTAEEELDALYGIDPDSAALIDVLIEQLEEDPDLLDLLSVVHRNDRNHPSFEVKRFQEVWKKNYTIYILKVWPADGPPVGYRVIYGHHPQKDIYYVLAVMDRDINYEADPSLIKRICDSYENFGIPRYR